MSERAWLETARKALIIAADAVEHAHDANPERGALIDTERGIRKEIGATTYIIDWIDTKEERPA